MTLSTFYLSNLEIRKKKLRLSALFDKICTFNSKFNKRKMHVNNKLYDENPMNQYIFDFALEIVVITLTLLGTVR